MRIIGILFLIISILTGCSTKDYYSFEMQNDIIVHTDKNYSNGTILRRLTDREEMSETQAAVAQNLPSFAVFKEDPTELAKVKMQAGQEMHTPDDLSATEWVPNQNPYAGYLYFNMSAIYASPLDKLETGVELGAVGPVSMAEITQKAVHNKMGMGDDPRGWDNQLPNEPTFNLFHYREAVMSINSWSDGISTLRLRIGTVYTDATFLTGLRLGYNLPALDRRSKEFSLYSYGQTGISIVGRNMFYDGTLFRESHSVTTEHSLVLAQAGVAALYGAYSARFETIFSSRQYEEQEENVAIYGGLIVGVDF